MPCYCGLKKRKMQGSSLRSDGIENHLDQHQARWFAVYTRYKSEKYVADKLARKGIEAYVPLLPFTRKYKSKTKHVEIPLISCYVFVKITKADYVRVLQTEHVISFLKLRKNLIAIPEREINTLRWVVGEKLTISATENTRLVKGAEVEVIAGNLTGLKGMILKRRNKKFFLVRLDTIGFTLEVDISKELLQITNPLSATG